MSTPAGPASLDEARSELKSRCDAIESAYEFLLAYAAQGLASDQGNNQVRDVRSASAIGRSRT